MKSSFAHFFVSKVNFSDSRLCPQLATINGVTQDQETFGRGGLANTLFRAMARVVNPARMASFLRFSRL